MSRSFAWVALIFVASLAGCAGDPHVVSQAEYDDIRPLMSYSEVSRIVGDRGEEVGRRPPAGSEDGVSAVHLSIYRWKNLDGSNMNALFCNDSLVNKAQNGLR